MVSLCTGLQNIPVWEKRFGVVGKFWHQGWLEGLDGGDGPEQRGATRGYVLAAPDWLGLIGLFIGMMWDMIGTEKDISSF